MAENETGAAAPQGDGAADRQLIINAQYVKDFSFENPRAPQSLLQQKDPPEVSLSVDVKAQNLAPDAFEVLLTIAAEATSSGGPVFVVDLTYAAVISVKGVPRETVPFLVLVETPRLLFPFARAVIASATREGGFPPLLIHPIDFAELLRRQQEGQGKDGGPVVA